MNLQTLSSHTIDLGLLPDAPLVLDVGCRDFDFSTAILRLRPDAHVIAMDPAPDLTNPKIPGIDYINIALIGQDGVSGSGFAHYSTGHGDFLTDLARYYDAEMVRVACVSITHLMKARQIKHFDAVKLDCEGSEFGILENWPGPIATQISVEFHDWNQRDKYNEQYFQHLFAKLAPWYAVIQHPEFIQGTGLGHWDSLLVKK